MSVATPPNTPPTASSAGRLRLQKLTAADARATQLKPNWHKKKIDTSERKGNQRKPSLGTIVQSWHSVLDGKNACPRLLNPLEIVLRPGDIIRRRLSTKYA